MPTQLEHLSDASFLGKLLVLPANVRLDWKVFARCKHSSLLGLVISNEERRFHNLATRTDFEDLSRTLKRMESECKSAWNYLRIVCRHDDSTDFEAK